MRRLKTFGLLAVLITALLFSVAAVTQSLEVDTKGWCLTSSWTYNRNVVEWTSGSFKLDTLRGVDTTTTGFIRFRSDTLRLVYICIGDTTAGLIDSVRLKVIREQAADTAFTEILCRDTIYILAAPTGWLVPTVATFPRISIFGAYTRFRYINELDSCRWAACVYGIDDFRNP